MEMIVAIGSTNLIKVEAVKECIQGYQILAGAKIFSFASPSEVSNQPLNLEETIQGAKNRARNAFLACENCNYSFGIEGGIFEAPGTQTGYLEASVCCIFDGTNYHIGLSSGFEVPPKILSLVLEEKMELGQACFESGISTNPKIGAAEGIISILTNGRLNRKEYTKQSITSAMIQLEHASWYNTTPESDSIRNQIGIEQ